MTTTAAAFLSRLERFGVVGSTNDIVRDWLAAGIAEVCVATADEQSAGRGRNNRTWTAPPGAALLLSAGFRPTWLGVAESWRLAAVVALAMADAADLVSGLGPGSVQLKWPNDLVVRGQDGVLKVGGVLGETDGLGGPDPRVVVGIGVNVDWQAADFPVELRRTMSSLREASGRAVDREALLTAFLVGLEQRTAALREGAFDATAWVARQATTGREVTLAFPDGSSQTRRALGVDPSSGALVVADDDYGRRLVLSAEIVHVRLAGAA